MNNNRRVLHYWQLLKTVFSQAIKTVSAIIALIFTLVPEGAFKIVESPFSLTDNTIIIINRIFVIIVVFILSIISSLWSISRKKSYVIQGQNYEIDIEYNDIFNMDDCIKVIPFDECYTVHTGDGPNQIKDASICGQYISRSKIDEQKIQNLIKKNRIEPCKDKSRYNNSVCYLPGTIIPCDDYFLMAFVKLDEIGKGSLTYDEYLACLDHMWSEIDKYYPQKDVCIPILGSGIARIGENMLSQQELLDIIIESYKLTRYKLADSHTLKIICRKRDGFSLLDIGTTL